MTIIGLKSERLSPHPSRNIEDWIASMLRQGGESLLEKDILVLSSKFVSYFEDRIVDLKTVLASDRAKKLAKKMNADERIIELALKEADEVIRETRWVLLTRKNGIFSANAGVDTSNVPSGCAVLWPEDPFESARKIRNSLRKKYELDSLAVLIIDSACTPGRAGTVSVAIGYSGLSGYQDLKGSKDLFGKILRYSGLNVVDSLATAANLIMGESIEATPAAIVRGYTWTEAEGNKKEEMLIAPSDDMFQGG